MTNGNGGTSPLRGIVYGDRSLDLVRFVEDPVDEMVAGVVRAALTLPTRAREAVRSQLTEGDQYTLMRFARRRAAFALREQSAPAAIEAIHALTLVREEAVDRRDVSVDFPLYAAGQLGIDTDELAASAADLSEGGTGQQFAAWAGRTAKLTLERCGLSRVVTRHGLGFVWTAGLPNAGAELVPAAVRIADAIDAQTDYRVESIHLSELPAVWFARRRPPVERVIDARDGVGIAALRQGAHRFGATLLVFMARLASEVAAHQLAAGASEAGTDERPRAAATDGAILLVAVGGSVTYGERPTETRGSMERLARDLLAAGRVGDAPN